ncbi:bile acid:sodium symporter family protein [Chloroflexota bacterium]
MSIKKLFRNRNFILVLSVVLGLTIGERGAVWTQPLVLPILALIMTLSTTNITSREFASIKTMLGRILVPLLINYIAMGGIILLMGRWLIDDNEIWTGLVVLAAVPTAIAAIPWTNLLGGDTFFSLISVMGAYLAALVLTPVIMVLFLGIDFFNPVGLLILLGELILIPIAASRILLFTGLAKRIEKWRGTVVNWSFFIILFTIIGLNNQAFFGEFDVLVRLSIIGIMVSFVLSYAIELIAKAFHARQETIISLIFVGAMKNFGLASGIMLTLFTERSTITSSIFIVFGLLRTLWLGFHFKKPT